MKLNRDIIIAFLSETSKLIRLALLIIVLVAIIFSLRSCSGSYGSITEGIEQTLNKWFGNAPDTLQYKAHSIEVLRIDGKSEVFLCSAEMQDFAIERQTQTKKFAGIKTSSQQRQLMVIERQNCHYILPLDSVQYIKADDEKTIYVKLPPLKYQAATTGEKVIIDNENFWRKFDHTPIAKRARKQIKDKFCTPANLKTAQTNASVIISKLVSELVDHNYKVVVENDIKKHLETKPKD